MGSRETTLLVLLLEAETTQVVFPFTEDETHNRALEDTFRECKD